MRIQDIMTTNIVTVSSDTSISDAADIMNIHRIRRLPVVDKGELIGIVTKDKIQSAAPPTGSTTSGLWKLLHVALNMRVSDIMSKHMVTVSPDTRIETAVLRAQQEKVGCLPAYWPG